MHLGRAHACAAVALVAIVNGTVASCGGSSEPGDGPPIPLPPRDAAGTPDTAPACDTASDPNNCGRCGRVCPSGPRGAAACSAGRCFLRCEAGWGDCNEDPTDGCETDVRSEVEHCGACKRDCRACGGTACTSSTCDGRIASTRPKNVDLLALDPTHVTYSNPDGVAQVDKADGGARSVYGVPNTPGLLVGDAVYFIYPGKDAVAGIYRTTAGFVGPQIAAFARGEDAEAMALDDTGLYYAVEKGNGVSRLLRCKDCSVPTELSGNENAFRRNAIALDATTVFFGAGDLIRRVEKTGSKLETLAIGQAARSLGVDETHVYWINEAPSGFVDAGSSRGEVVRVPKTGGTPEKIITGLVRPTYLVVGEEHLYVADRGSGGADGVVLRTAKDGSGRLDLARGVGALGGIAADAQCIWFAAGPQIRQLTR